MDRNQPTREVKTALNQEMVIGVTFYIVGF